MKRQIAIGLCVAVVATTITPAPVAADEHSFLEDVLGVDGDDEDDDAGSFLGSVGGLVDAARSVASGIRARFVSWAGSIGEEIDVDERADELAEEYNDHNGSFESYANIRTTATTDFDVLEIELEADDESATRYLVATVSNGSYENSSVVSSTSRSADHWVLLCGPAAREAPEELERFRETFVDTGKSVSDTYLQELAGRYGGHVKSDLFNDSRECS